MSVALKFELKIEQIVWVTLECHVLLEWPFFAHFESQFFYLQLTKLGKIDQNVVAYHLLRRKTFLLFSELCYDGATLTHKM